MAAEARHSRSQGIIWGVGGWGRGPANAMADKRAQRAATKTAQNASGVRKYVVNGTEAEKQAVRKYLDGSASLSNAEVAKGLKAMGYSVSQGAGGYIEVVKVGPTTRFITTVDGVTTDLQPTLNRIASGGKYPHRNDGSVFMNKEGLLPIQGTGYYKEFVHPTPGGKGPGPQRIVTGQNGQMWYTPDHYKTFIPVR